MSKETFEDKKRRKEWKDANRKSEQVQKWLKKNPPPKGWDGDGLDWAYTEMPFFANWFDVSVDNDL